MNGLALVAALSPLSNWRIRNFGATPGWPVSPFTGAEEWRDINKTDQVRLIGNSVCPDEAEALVNANFADIIDVLPAPRRLIHSSTARA
jgi:site-specific DNA-cytosine methylase